MAFDDPRSPVGALPPAPFEPFYLSEPAPALYHHRPVPQRWWLHVLLFLLTVASTAWVGVDYYGSFMSVFGTRPVTLDATLLLKGLFFSAAVLGILGAHEMGHYVACRIYRVDATLPFFLPFPFLSISGTLGAVIRIREPFPSRKALFDIGIAGPIAGFVVLVPVLFYAVWRSEVVQAPAVTFGWSFGEPLLFKLATWLKFGVIREGYQLNLHPIGFGAWFGMLATAFNLLPFGQLDGGHVTYATLGDRSRYVSLATVIFAVVMCFVSRSWLVMTLMMIGMLYFLGPRHPRPLEDDDAVGPWRQALAVFALIMFALCFMPVPLEFIGAGQ